MKKELSIKDALQMSQTLWENNKDSWDPMTPEFGRDSILYMIEEIGEVISLIKKKGEPEIIKNGDVRQRFIEEMCDVLMYYSDVLNRFDISSRDFSQVYYEKFNKNMERDFIKDHSEI